MSDRYPSLRTADLAEFKDQRKWIWAGLIAPGFMTLFTSMWKSGKTTLIAHLLASRREGRPLLGRSVTAGASVVISEEPPPLWQERHAELNFGATDQFICRPFKTAPTAAEWAELMDDLHKRRRESPFDLLIVDPLAHCLPPGGELHAETLLNSLLGLRSLAQEGVAVLLVHHPRKATAEEGMRSRGSGVLPAFVDILIEMYPVQPDDPGDRRRRLRCFSRESSTPQTLAFERSTDGRTLQAIALPDDFSACWAELRKVFENARGPLSREEVRKDWPPELQRPTANLLWKWLARAQQHGKIVREGTGRRNDPYRYFMPEKMKQWMADPIFQMNRQAREDRQIILDLCESPTKLPAR